MKPPRQARAPPARAQYNEGPTGDTMAPRSFARPGGVTQQAEANAKAFGRPSTRRNSEVIEAAFPRVHSVVPSESTR